MSYQKSCVRTMPFVFYLFSAVAVTDHGPIGDAIDTDGSGFVSVREVNRFTRACPSGWTFPQWLALYAPFRYMVLDRSMTRLAAGR